MPQVFVSCFATKSSTASENRSLLSPGDHVARFGHVDVVGMRHEREEFAHMRLLHQLGRAAAHQQGRDRDRLRGLDQRASSTG
jgi:hypothetical protein